MVKSAKQKTAYKPYKTASKPKKHSQTCKRPAVVSGEVTRLQRQELESMLKWLVENRRGGYRFIAKHTIGAARFGWLQRVATGKKDVKPTRADLEKIRRLYDLLVEDHDITAERLSKMLRLTELMAEVNQIIVWVMRQE